MSSPPATPRDRQFYHDPRTFPFHSPKLFWPAFAVAGLTASTFFVMGFVIFFQTNDDLKGSLEDVRLRKEHAMAYHKLLYGPWSYAPPQTPREAVEAAYVMSVAMYKDLGYHSVLHEVIWGLENLIVPAFVLLFAVGPIAAYRSYYHPTTPKPTDKSVTSTKIVKKEANAAGRGLQQPFLMYIARLFVTTLFWGFRGFPTSDMTDFGLSRFWALMTMLFSTFDLACMLGHAMWRLALPAGNFSNSVPLPRKSKDIEMQPIHTPSAPADSRLWYDARANAAPRTEDASDLKPLESAHLPTAADRSGQRQIGSSETAVDSAGSDTDNPFDTFVGDKPRPLDRAWRR